MRNATDHTPQLGTDSVRSRTFESGYTDMWPLIIVLATLAGIGKVWRAYQTPIGKAERTDVCTDFANGKPPRHPWNGRKGRTRNVPNIGEVEGESAVDRVARDCGRLGIVIKNREALASAIEGAVGASRSLPPGYDRLAKWIREKR